MIIRNCLQLLLELSRLEEKIAATKASATSSSNKNDDQEILQRHVKRVQRLL